jgi:hypothetical protein
MDGAIPCAWGGCRAGEAATGQIVLLLVESVGEYAGTCCCLPEQTFEPKANVSQSSNRG